MDGNNWVNGGPRAAMKRAASARDLASLDRVSLSQVACLLASLPLLLAVFAFVISDPPATVELEALAVAPGEGDAAQALNSSTGALLQSGCSVARKKEYFFPHGQWHSSLQPQALPRLGIMTTTAAGMEQVLPWLYYHRSLGVEVFLIFTEGTANEPQNVAVLETIPGVKVIPRNAELDELQSYKPGRNKTLLWSMAGRPCNYELFVKQALNGDTAIPLAKNEGVEWLIHIDTDELLYPAGTETYSLQSLFTDLDAATNFVVFTNYESVVERDDVHDPFLEVTLFKKSGHHVDREAFSKHAKEAMHGNPNYMLTYGNGKSAARVVEGLRSNGAHRFNILIKKYKEVSLPQAAVLHYSYTQFSDLTSRSKRCHCKPTKKAVKSCFFLDFDRQAYIVAATQTEEQMLLWYRKRVVWTDRAKVLKMLRLGLFARIYTPQVIMRGILQSGLIEATLKAGQEEFQRRKFLKRLEARNSTFGLQSGNGSSSSRAAEGAWNHILGSVYGLVSKVQQKRLRALGLREQNVKEMLRPQGRGQEREG